MAMPLTIDLRSMQANRKLLLVQVEAENAVEPGACQVQDTAVHGNLVAVLEIAITK